MCKQLVVIQSDDPKEFEKAFNAKLRELENCKPEYEFHHGAGYCAYIIYSDNHDLSGIVKHNFRYLCDTCMKCVETPHPRVKWRRCGVFGTVDGKKNCDHYIEVEVFS